MQKKIHLNIKGKSNYTCKDVTSKHDHELYVLVMVSSTDECMKITFYIEVISSHIRVQIKPTYEQYCLIGKMFQVSF